MEVRSQDLPRVISRHHRHRCRVAILWPWILTKLAIYGHWTITSWGGELLSTLSISHLGGLHVGEPFFSAVGGLVHCGGFEAKKANDAEWA